jgi:hypothetical protein
VFDLGHYRVEFGAFEVGDACSLVDLLVILFQLGGERRVRSLAFHPLPKSRLQSR